MIFAATSCTCGDWARTTTAGCPIHAYTVLEVPVVDGTLDPRFRWPSDLESWEESA